MADQTKAPRLFIQTDPLHEHANIARWVEVSMTTEFVTRVQTLHSLLGQHRLQLVTSDF